MVGRGEPERVASFPPPIAPSVGAAALPDHTERRWAALSHLSVPFFSFVGPLLVYLLLADRSAWLKENVAEALDFSVLVAVGYLVSGVLAVVTFFVGGLAGAVFALLLGVGSLGLCVLAAASVHRGETYRYPLNWRLVK